MIERFDDAAAAVKQSPAGAGVLVLADQYPRQTTRLAPGLFDQARDKKLRLYMEYPSFVPALKLDAPATLKIGHLGNILERTVVVSDAFGDALLALDDQTCSLVGPRQELECQSIVPGKRV